MFIFRKLLTLEVYNFNPQKGPKVLMLAKMFNDMTQFLLLMVVFLAAYGISTQACDALFFEVIKVV